MIKKKDLTVWVRIQRGDKVAFGEVYYDHVDSLYNYGSSFTSDVQLLEDAIQEVFINIWTKRSSISIKSNIKGYLFTSLRRQIISQIGKRNNIELSADFLEKNTFQNLAFIQADYRMEEVRAEIAKLPNREREAIILKYQEGLSYDDISSLMNLKSQAIYKLVSRGMKKLRCKINAKLKLLV